MVFKTNRTACLIFAALALVAVSARGTTISGQYNNAMYGYTASGGSFSVTSTAEFNDDTYYGFSTNSGAVGTITGGQFEDDDREGIFLFESSVGTLSNPTVTGNGIGLYDAQQSTATVNSGTFANNAIGIEAMGLSEASIFGGTFSGNGVDLSSDSGSIDLYGSFPGLSPGETQTLTGDGSFTGILENDLTSQTFSYETTVDSGDGLTSDGTVTLHEVVPEPASVGIICAGAAALLLRRRARGKSRE
jgi:hypothetical protein